MPSITGHLKAFCRCKPALMARLWESTSAALLYPVCRLLRVIYKALWLIMPHRIICKTAWLIMLRRIICKTAWLIMLHRIVCKTVWLITLRRIFLPRIFGCRILLWKSLRARLLTSLLLHRRNTHLMRLRSLERILTFQSFSLL